MTCIFEVTIFELFFRGLLRRRYSSPIFYIAIYIGVVSLIYGINSLGNSKLNLIANILIWENQSHLARFIVICLEKLITFVTLFIIKKKLNKQKYGIKNEILLYSLVLPIATFGIYSALLYSGLMVEVSGINEGILLVGCILLLFANAIIFFLYEYIFRLNYENQAYIDINVFATQKGHFLMIRVENKFDGIVKKKGDDFCSTKQEPDKHGIGLKNVADCVNKYGGILQIDVNDNIFTVSVIFTVL